MQFYSTEAKALALILVRAFCCYHSHLCFFVLFIWNSAGRSVFTILYYSMPLAVRQLAGEVILLL